MAELQQTKTVAFHPITAQKIDNPVEATSMRIASQRTAGASNAFQQKRANRMASQPRTLISIIIDEMKQPL